VSQELSLSIVDDALHTLGQNSHIPDLMSKPGTSASPQVSSVAHELYRGRSSAPRSRPWPLISALGMLVLGGGAWWVMDRATPKPTPLPTPAPITLALKTPAPVPTAATSAPEPAASAPAAVAPEPVAVAAVTPASAMVVPAAAAALPIAPIAPAVTVAPSHPSQPALAVASTLATPPTRADKATPTTEWPTVTAPAWHGKGWQMVEQAHPEQAVETWEAGVAQLNTRNRLVVYALAHRSLPPALAQARRMAATAPAIVVRENVDGQPQYRVLLLGDALVTPLAIKNQLAAQAPYLWVAPAPRFDTAALRTETQGAPVTVAASQPAVTKPKETATVASAPVRVESSLQFSVDDSAAKALDALAHGDKTEATRLADMLLTKQPDRWEGHYVQGAVLLSAGRAREAEAPLDNALRLNPGSASVLLQRAIAAQESGQPGKAVVWLRQARTLAPEIPAVWLNLGYSAELSGATEEAASAYQRYLQITAGRSGAETQRAYVTERLRVLGK
jgi:Flp pilus assembly protein TadD